jgi:hypothetical protein
MLIVFISGNIETNKFEPTEVYYLSLSDQLDQFPMVLKTG